jgi:small subunit ribosomal protein S21
VIPVGKVISMAKVYLREGDTIDDALARFKRQVIRDGTLNEVRNRQFFMNNREWRKVKQKEAQALKSKAKKKKKF